MADASPRTAEKLLAHGVQIQVDTMTRRGTAPDLIAREAKALETAIRCELCRLTILGDTA
jgi:hypothetical protein